jgi:hypothetical protein
VLLLAYLIRCLCLQSASMHLVCLREIICYEWITPEMLLPHCIIRKCFIYYVKWKICDTNYIPNFPVKGEVKELGNTSPDCTPICTQDHQIFHEISFLNPGTCWDRRRIPAENWVMFQSCWLFQLAVLFVSQTVVWLTGSWSGWLHGGKASWTLWPTIPTVSGFIFAAMWATTSVKHVHCHNWKNHRIHMNFTTSM